ncbi:hypothetical protein EDD37DRAFT_613213 [Exophiala viscosa]|uniref:uncharacterized protein n=1 Tax=Exophiala viscosa TaxID=2486360 RepID=UPI002191D737|nr:hypothetical protein EDD37DRAFT_613213 [Exophiala viscosa]
MYQAVTVVSARIQKTLLQRAGYKLGDPNQFQGLKFEDVATLMFLLRRCCVPFVIPKGIDTPKQHFPHIGIRTIRWSRITDVDRRFVFFLQTLVKPFQTLCPHIVITKLNELYPNLFVCGSNIFEEVDHSLDRARNISFVDELRWRFDEISKDASDAYALTHQLEFATPTDALLRRRQIVQQALDLNVAIEARRASEALYKECYDILCKTSRQNKPQPGLELHVFANEQGDSPHLAYRMTVALPSADRETDVLVEGPIRPQPTGQIESDFSSACGSIRRALPAFFTILQNQTFRLQTLQAHGRRKSDCNSSQWVAFLESVKTRNSQVRRFRTQEKLELALQIVETGFFLLGTSWLRHLDGSFVHVNNCGELHQQRFVLTFAGRADANLNHVEPHLFHIGTLLTELALFTQCRIKSWQVDTGYEYDLAFFCDERKKHLSLPPRDMLIYLQRKSDVGKMKQYYTAVQFCLQQSENFHPEWYREHWDIDDWEERKAAYAELLKEYYTQVYKP